MIINKVISLNIIDFVSIKSQIGDKKVILIFDDLERANLSVIDLLGCINEYCENMHINTIKVFIIILFDFVFMTIKI